MWLRSDKRELRVRSPKTVSAIPGIDRCNRRKRKRSKISSEKCFLKGSSVHYSRFHKKENKYTAQTAVSDEITLFDGKLKSKRFNNSTVNSIKSTDSLSLNNDVLNQFGPILYNTKTSTLVAQEVLEDGRDCCCNRSTNAQFSEPDKRNDKNKKCISEIYNNPRFDFNSSLTKSRPIINGNGTDASKTYSKVQKKHQEVLDQYASPYQKKNLQQMPDMVYEALAMEQNYSMKSLKNFAQYSALPTPDYSGENDSEYELLKF